MNNTATREVLGNHYRLAVVQKKGTAPSMVDKMLKALLDEMDAQGNFSFHPTGPLEPALQAGDPRVTARIDDGLIVLNLRWNEGPDNSVRGHLYVPNGRTPPEILKQINHRLAYLNDVWPDTLGMSESAKSAPPVAASPPPQASKPAEEPTKATTPAPKASPAPPAPIATAKPAVLGEKDEQLALEFFHWVGDNGVIKYQRIYDHGQAARREDDQKVLPMIEVIGRLEKKGMLRRVKLELGGEWQFTEAFIKTHGLNVPGYTPLPEVFVAPRGGKREPVRALERVPAPAATTVEPQTEKPHCDEESCPGLDRLRKLYGNLDRLQKRHQAAKICLEAAEQEIADIDAELKGVQADIAAAKEALNKDDLLKLVLHR